MYGDRDDPAPASPRSAPARRAARRRSGAASARSVGSGTPYSGGETPAAGCATTRQPGAPTSGRFAVGVGGNLAAQRLGGGVDGVAGHGPVGRVLAADDRHHPHRRLDHGVVAGQGRGRRGRRRTRGGQQRAQPGVGAEQVGALDLAAQQLVDVAQQVVDVLLVGRRVGSCRRSYGVSVVPSSQWPYHLRRMITESSALDRMPVVESNASLRTSRCTPLAGAMLNVCAPASCWISAAHTPAAFTTTRAETSNDSAALHVFGRHAGDPAVGVRCARRSPGRG